MKMTSAVLALVLAGMLMIAGSRSAAAQPAAAPAGSIRVIDMVQVFNSLNDKKNGDAEIEQMANDLKRQRDAVNADLEQMAKELQTLNADSAIGKDAMDKAMKKGLELQNFSSYMEQKLTMEQRVRTAALYKKINDAVATYAKTNNVSLVIVTDKDDMHDARTPQELQQRITLRKVIYADEKLDITRTIIENMNAASHLGPAAAPAGH